MAMIALVSNEEKIIQHKIIKKIAEEEINIAMSIFNEYKRKGIILCEFSDNKWKITNEVDSIGLNFAVNEVLIKKYLKSYTANEFVNILKCYMCFCLGQYSLATLREILLNIKKVIEQTQGFLAIPKNKEVLEGTGVGDFIDLFPCANEELIVESIDYTHNRHRRRTLAEYESYFLFNEKLNEFWEEKATDDEKKLYFPIYLWWKISMIIPLRVTEFTVIPKVCTRKVKNQWMLKIRRTDLKGKAGKIHGYKIDEDYKIYEYAVTDEIVSIIQDYKDKARDYDESEIDSLFSDDMFVSLLDSKGLERMSHLKVNHMSLLMNYFYTDILKTKLGLSILSKEDILRVDISGQLKQLNRNEIVKISLGDSRHIAMQNMILNGCNILMAKEITGHESANEIYHYAGNMKNLIKCRVYSLYKMSKKKEVAMSMITKTNTSMFLPRVKDPYMEVDGGLCYSVPFVVEQDTKDCFAVAGNCEKCRWFKSKKGNRVIRKDQEKIVEEKIERLLIWLHSTRMNKNKDEFRVMVNQLTANVENLQNGYIQDLKDGGKI